MPIFSTYSHIMRVIVTMISTFKNKCFWSSFYAQPILDIEYTTKNIYIAF